MISGHKNVLIGVHTQTYSICRHTCRYSLTCAQVVVLPEHSKPALGSAGVINPALGSVGVVKP